MLQSDKLKLLFTHQPKSGGSSVTLALVPFLDVPRVVRVDTSQRGWQLGLHSIGHMHGRYQAERVELLRELGYQVACTTRNPWVRVASSWSNRAAHRGVSFYDYITFKDPKTPPSWEFLFYSVSELAGPNVDFILHFEELESDFHTMMESLGHPCQLPHVNQHAHTFDILERAYEDPRCAEIVAEKCQEDIERFGYRFPL